MNSKRSIWMSGISLLICIAMLAGTTFAWFSDSISNKDNKIQAGNLDINLYQWYNSEEQRMFDNVNQTISAFPYYDDTNLGWVDIGDSGNPIFSEHNGNGEVLWEPGMNKTVFLALENAGTLDLNYQIDITVKGDYTLAQAFTFSTYDGAVNNDSVTFGTKAKNSVPLNALLSKNLINGKKFVEVKSGMMAKNEVVYFAITLEFMRGAGNSYQGEKLEFDVNVIATQTNTGAVNAVVPVATQADLEAALAVENASIVFVNDITLDKNLSTNSHVNIDTNGYTLDLGGKTLTFGNTTNYAVYTITGNFTNGTIALDNVNGHFNVHNGLVGANLTIEGTYSNSAEVSGKWGKIDVNGNKVGKTTLNDVDVDELNVNTPAPIIGSGTFGEVNVNGGNEEGDQENDSPKANVTFQGSDTDIGELNINKDLQGSGGGEGGENTPPPITFDSDTNIPKDINVVDENGEKTENTPDGLIQKEVDEKEKSFYDLFEDGVVSVLWNGNVELISKYAYGQGPSFKLSEVFGDTKLPENGYTVSADIYITTKDTFHFRTTISDSATLGYKTEIGLNVDSNQLHTENRNDAKVVLSEGWYTFEISVFKDIDQVTGIAYLGSRLIVKDEKGITVFDYVKGFNEFANQAEAPKWDEIALRNLWFPMYGTTNLIIRNLNVQAGAKEGNIVFEDDFTDGIGNWDGLPELSDWLTIDNGVAVVNNPDGTKCAWNNIMGNDNMVWYGENEFSVDVYIDLENNDEGATFAAHVNIRTATEHRRDFIINFKKIGSGFSCVIANNTSVDFSNPDFVVTTSGWYTIVFKNNMESDKSFSSSISVFEKDGVQIGDTVKLNNLDDKFSGDEPIKGVQGLCLIINNTMNTFKFDNFKFTT